MKLEDYRKRLRENPEYIAEKRKLQPFLDLADEVLRIRQEKGWSQTELARRVGTKQANISRIESGIGNPTLGFVQKLADALDADFIIQLTSVKEIESVSVSVKNELVAQVESPIYMPYWPTKPKEWGVYPEAVSEAVSNQVSI